MNDLKFACNECLLKSTCTKRCKNTFLKSNLKPLFIKSLLINKECPDCKSKNMSFQIKKSTWYHDEIIILIKCNECPCSLRLAYSTEDFDENDYEVDDLVDNFNTRSFEYDNFLSSISIERAKVSNLKLKHIDEFKHEFNDLINKKIDTVNNKISELKYVIEDYKKLLFI